MQDNLEMTSTSHRKFIFLAAPSLLALFACILTIRGQYYEYTFFASESTKIHQIFTLQSNLFPLVCNISTSKTSLGCEQKRNTNFVNGVRINAPEAHPTKWWQQGSSCEQTNEPQWQKVQLSPWIARSPLNYGPKTHCYDCTHYWLTCQQAFPTLIHPTQLNTST